MRIDKFLKSSRLIKRRTIAKEMCDAHKISVNGKLVKPGFEVEVGQQITVEYATMTLVVEVTSLAITPSKATAADCYTEISRTAKTRPSE